MTCDELRELHELYALGALDSAERFEVEEHLARQCPDCTRRFRRALAMNAAILSAAPDAPAPPKDLRCRIVAMVGGAPSRWDWTTAWAAIAACLFAAVLWFSVRDREHATELAGVRERLQHSHDALNRMRQGLSVLNEPDTRQIRFGEGADMPPRGSVFVNPRSGILLVAADLRTLPPDKAYELWVVPKSGSPRPAGLFQADSMGSAIHLKPGPPDADIAAVAVTVEPSAGSAQPTSPPVLTAEVGGW